jgi:hypothetical protein
MARRVDYEPMTFGNMRAHGMTRLDVSCHGYLCGNRTMIDVSRYPDDAIVAHLQFLCARCGSRNVDARPDWIQYADHYRALPKP